MGGAADSLKIVLSATEDGKAKRPHQAFLLLRDQDTGLEATFPFSVKENGKGKVDFTQKDLPIQLLTSTQPLQATVLLASFGTTQGFSNHIFNLDVKLDSNVPLPKYEAPLRYGQREEIHHLSKAIGAAPVSHSLFFGSILSMEGIFFLYYSSWNLFQTLPAAGVVGLVAFLSGSKALSEVQSRRLAGER